MGEQLDASPGFAKDRKTWKCLWWTAKEEEERFRAIAELLRTIHPVERG